MRPVISLVALTALATLSSCAPASGPGAGSSAGVSGPRTCFTTNRITNYRQGQEQQLYVRVLGNDVYQLSGGFCRDINASSSLQITSTTGSGDRLCVGDTAAITAQGAGGPSFPGVPCRAVVTRKLTEAEVAALPPGDRP
jgi:hypothetical protein